VSIVADMSSNPRGFDEKLAPWTPFLTKRRRDSLNFLIESRILVASNVPFMHMNPIS